MNLVLLEEGDLVTARRARLVGRRFDHLRDVRRVQLGESVRVGILGGGVGRGAVTDLGADHLVLELVIDGEPPPALPLTMVLALPRPKALRRLLQGVAAVGVKRIVLLESRRVEKSYWQSPYLAEHELRQQLILGLEQGCDTILPVLEMRRRFKPFVEDELPELARHTRALVAHPAATTECPRGLREAVTLAIGPEGGFSDYEIELLQSNGFTAVSLGPRPLRVEQAVPALIGRLF